MNNSKEEIFQFLTEVKDPEVPVVDIVELGIVRNVECKEGAIEIVVTPTYSGCPATKMIENEILAKLREKGCQNVSVRTTFSSPWTTDFITEKAKQKLKDYGIAPPGKVTEENLYPSRRKVGCPFCDSAKTELRSEFGSTACKSLYYCNSCNQPFEHFKCI